MTIVTVQLGWLGCTTAEGIGANTCRRENETKPLHLCELCIRALEHRSSHCPVFHLAYTSPSALGGQLSVWHAKELQKGFRKLASAGVPCQRCASERQKFRPVYAGLWHRQIAVMNRNRLSQWILPCACASLSHKFHVLAELVFQGHSIEAQMGPS